MSFLDYDFTGKSADSTKSGDIDNEFLSSCEDFATACQEGLELAFMGNQCADDMNLLSVACERFEEDGNVSQQSLVVMGPGVADEILASSGAGVTVESFDSVPSDTNLEAVTEGFKETMKKIGHAIAEFFRKIAKWFKEFFAKMFDKNTKLMNKVGKLIKKKSDITKATTKQLKKAKTKVVKKERFDKFAGEFGGGKNDEWLSMFKSDEFESKDKNKREEMIKEYKEKIKTLYGKTEDYKLSDKADITEKGYKDGDTCFKAVEDAQKILTKKIELKKFGETNANYMKSASKEADNLEKIGKEDEAKEKKESLSAYQKLSSTVSKNTVTVFSMADNCVSSAINAATAAIKAGKKKEDDKDDDD